MSSNQLNRYDFIIIMFAFLLIWILVGIWQRVIDNFCIGYLCIHKDSFLPWLLIALLLTLIFAIGAYCSTKFLRGITG